MAGPDLPPIPTEHSAEVIGDNFPQHSETDNVMACLSLFEKSAHSVNSGDVADAMFALIEATAKGETPENLMAGFTDDQREAFKEAMKQLNQGQGASVAAQDILNTKVQMNGVVETFEAAVQELIAEYAGKTATSPRSQQEFQEKYQALLNQAKDQVNQLGQNHKSTQDQLMAGITKGVEPTVPPTMATGNGSTVPGMPSDAMGGLLQQVGNTMSRPPNLPMPDVQRAIQPATNGMQQGLAALLQGGGKGGGVDVSRDALSKLVSSTADRNAANPLSAPGARPVASRHEQGGATGLRSPLSVRSADDQRPLTVSPPGGDNSLGLDAHEETRATLATEPATTDRPESPEPQVALSSGAAVDAAPPLAHGTHLSSGDATAGGATVGAGAPHSAGAAPMGGMGMMGPMMGPITGGAPATSSSSGTRKKPSAVKYDPRAVEPHEVDAELRDFGYDMKGLEHATDKQMIAASILAGIIRANRSRGVATQAAVGVGTTGAVFVTSDGLGFIPEGVKLVPHARPLITGVPDEFIARWIGCDQPWRALLEAVGQRFVGPFDAIVATDPDAEPHGVMALTGEQIDAVNIAAGTAERWDFDAVHETDIADAITALTVVWGAPEKKPEDAYANAVSCRWRGDHSSNNAAARSWARYLVAAAATASALHKDADASYLVRVALRVPELLGEGRD
jgi:hypothetical protein